MDRHPHDPSRGYDAVAADFVRRRNPGIGEAAARQWAGALPRGGTVLDLGCGDGIPISRALLAEGLQVHAIDASPTMVAAYRERFPTAPVACEAAEDSRFFGRTFDGVIAWGLVFLLEPDTQVALIHRIAAAVVPGGRFLFTSPRQPCRWTDVLTGRESVSLGRDVYAGALEAAGFALLGEHQDEGANHYFDALRR